MVKGMAYTKLELVGKGGSCKVFKVSAGCHFLPAVTSGLGILILYKLLATCEIVHEALLHSLEREPAAGFKEVNVLSAH